MASEFDEALSNFLRSEGLMMHVAGVNEGLQVQLLRISDGEAVAVTEAADLDVAVNLAVDQAVGLPMRGMGDEGPIGFQRNEDDLEPNLRWSQKYKNSLPDSAFLYVRQDCVKYTDDSGRSHPLSCRDLPVKNLSGAYDYAHVKNAISRAVQLEGVPRETQRRLQAEARRIFEREFG